MGLIVNEIFHSIQGESSFAGRPCVFIRLTGCNLRCSYCDTKYAYLEGKHYELCEIVDAVRSYRCPLVAITGGEPLIQKETPDLVKHLIDDDFKVLVETNGSIDIDKICRACVRIVDIKCPSSGENAKNDLKNMKRLTENDELKFVVGHRDDYNFAKSMLNAFSSDCQRVRKIHFSPVFEIMPPDRLAQWIVADRLDVRLQLQLHKYIWDPDRRGV